MRNTSALQEPDNLCANRLSVWCVKRSRKENKLRKTYSWYVRIIGWRSRRRMAWVRRIAYACYVCAPKHSDRVRVWCYRPRLKSWKSQRRPYKHTYYTCYCQSVPVVTWVLSASGLGCGYWLAQRVQSKLAVDSVSILLRRSRNLASKPQGNRHPPQAGEGASPEPITQQWHFQSRPIIIRWRCQVFSSKFCTCFVGFSVVWYGVLWDAYSKYQVRVTGCSHPIHSVV